MILPRFTGIHWSSPENGGPQMRMKIDEIKIGDRCRKDMGNLEALVDSIARNGLLQPIAITPDKRLIDGLNSAVCRLSSS